MRFHDSRTLAFLNGLIISGIYAVVFSLSVLIIFPGAFGNTNTYIALLTSTGLLFLISFLSIRYSVERFIYGKIRLIYKTIHSVKVGKDKRDKIKRGNGILDNVQQEVAEWEQEKQQEIDRLMQLEQYRRDFIGNVSHELKTPLFNIQGYVLTLLDGALEDPSINRVYLKRTENSVERLIRIVEDLNEISELESGQVKLNLSRFDICHLAREVQEMLEMKATKKNVVFVVTPQEKPVWVEADREKIRQVLTNIMDNAIRYRNVVEGRVKVNFFDMDEFILTEVTDNGIGIAQEEIPRVFERFYRTDRGRVATKKGRGLGLAIAKHIIEAHQQSIHCRSTIGVGTTFGFTLKKG